MNRPLNRESGKHGLPGPGPAGPRPPGRGFGHGPMGPGAMMLPMARARNFKGTVKRLTGYLKPFWPQLVAVLLTAALSTVFAIFSPKLLGNATTIIFEGVAARWSGDVSASIDYGAIGRILLTLIFLYAFSSLFAYLQQYWMAGVAQKTVYALRRDLNAKLARLPLKYYDSRPHGETLSRVTNDVDTISSTLQQSLTQIFTSLVTIVGVVIMMLTISPWLTLICVLTLPLGMLVTVRIAKRSQGYFIGQQRSLGELNGHVEEMYAGHTVIQAFGLEDKSIGRFRELNDRLYDYGWRAQFVSGIIMPLMGMVGNLGYVLICVVGGLFVAGQRIAIGDVQAFIQYARQFSFPINQVANIANIIQSTVAAAERVFELMDEGEEDDADAAGHTAGPVSEPEGPAAFPAGAGSSGVTAAGPKGAVRFENVRFGYSPDAPLMDNLNLDVRPGQTVAIVGPTGAGKTTLVNLLMRFYDVQGGRITIDGRDIREFPRGELRRMFGMVLQDTWLFHGTIRDNIAYGREGATEEEIVRAARAAHADHFIRALPNGYDTVLNEEASNLSQGQKQLLTIARAFLADPAILILDEATSSVDTRTEARIQLALSRLMKGRTSFVIAHRLSTIRSADLILVMDRGSIVEQGTHEELLAAGGFYAELYNSQFEAAAAQEAM